VPGVLHVVADLVRDTSIIMIYTTTTQGHQAVMLGMQDEYVADLQSRKSGSEEVPGPQSR
jgi:hypothetical protein